MCLHKAKAVKQVLHCGIINFCGNSIKCEVYPGSENCSFRIPDPDPKISVYPGSYIKSEMKN
jgi:hypothetical protein